MNKSADELAVFLLGIQALAERLEPTRRPEDIGVPDCSVREIRALRALSRHRRLAMNALAAQIEAPISSTTRIVKLLVAKGLVRRSLSTTDRRVVEVTFAPLGEEIDSYVREFRETEARAMLGTLSQRERKAFLRQLSRMVAESAGG